MDDEDSDALDEELHALFEKLRGHVVSLSGSFGSKLGERLDEVEQHLAEAPESLPSLFLSSVVQLSNIAVGLFRPDPDGGPDDPGRSDDGADD